MYFTLNTPAVVKLDAAAMLDKAYAPSAETTFTIPRMANITTSSVNAFVDQAARKVNRPRRNAYYYVSHGKMRWRPAVLGRGLNVTTSRAP